MKRVTKHVIKPKCKQTGKSKYASHVKAKRDMFFIWANDPSVQVDDLHTYRCPFCKWIHIGHKIPKESAKETKNGLSEIL